MTGYDPFTYNPMLRSYYVSGTFHHLSPEDQQISAANPDLKNHINSVALFVDWLKKRHPEAYTALAKSKPDLISAGKTVASGSVVKKSGLSGLGDGEEETSNTPSTDWGQSITGFFQQVLPSYYQFRAQKDLIDLNIARAEKGLPPIDSSAISPQVNVGVSKNVQTLGMLAIGGLVLVGLLSAFKRR